MRFLAVIALCLSAIPCTPRAATLIDAQTGFSADRTLVVDGHTYRGKVWAMPGRERHEQAILGLQPVFLLRGDSPLAEVVLTSIKTVVQFEIPSGAASSQCGGAGAAPGRPRDGQRHRDNEIRDRQIDPRRPCRGHAVAEPRRYSDAACRHVHECEGQGIDDPLGAQRGQDRAASGDAVRPAGGIVEAARRRSPHCSV